MRCCAISGRAALQGRVKGGTKSRGFSPSGWTQFPFKKKMEPGKSDTKKPIRVLLLDDREDNLILRAAILRSHGYEAVTSASVEQAETHLQAIDIAVLDYHL